MALTDCVREMEDKANKKVFFTNENAEIRRREQLVAENQNE